MDVLTKEEINMYAADFGVNFEGNELEKLQGLLRNIPSVAVQKRVLLRFYEDCALNAIHSEMLGGPAKIIKPDAGTIKEFTHGHGKG